MKVVVMSKAEQIVAGLGGADNIDEIEACITRLRVEVGDESLVDESALKDAGAFGVVAHGKAVQVVVGPESDLRVEYIECLMDCSCLFHIHSLGGKLGFMVGRAEKTSTDGAPSSGSLLARLRSLEPALSRGPAAVGRAVIEDPLMVVPMTIQQLAAHSGTSDASVIRLAQAV